MSQITRVIASLTTNAFGTNLEPTLETILIELGMQDSIRSIREATLINSGRTLRFVYTNDTIKDVDLPQTIQAVSIQKQGDNNIMTIKGTDGSIVVYTIESNLITYNVVPKDNSVTITQTGDERNVTFEVKANIPAINDGNLILKQGDLVLGTFTANQANDTIVQIPTISGQDGEQGIQGEKGEDGDSAYVIWLKAGNRGTEEDFLDSLKGTKGDKGDKGDTGEQGPQGIQGLQGVQGAKGDKGDDGENGENGKSAYDLWLEQGNIGSLEDFLASLKGETGAKGDTGEKGDKGDKGDTGEKGDQGVQGLQGVQGIQGIQGAKGDKGDPFTIAKTYSSVAEMQDDLPYMEINDYVMIASSVEDADNAKLYVKTNNGWSFITDFSGATGIKGEKGDTGEQGIQGIQGVAGAQGAKGDNGQDGKSAYQIALDNGFVGTEQQWLASLKGQDGANGTNGTNGQDGADGQDGITPHIDSTTKHWMIGDTDTGVVAEGQDGQDGSGSVSVVNNSPYVVGNTNNEEIVIGSVNDTPLSFKIRRFVKPAQNLNLNYINVVSQTEYDSTTHSETEGILYLIPVEQS